MQTEASCNTYKTTSLFKARRHSFMPSQQDSLLILASPGDKGRHSLETFVYQEFLEQHGASISNFMPWLLGITIDNTLTGVAGMRPAANTALFIEQYLDEPVEQCLASATAAPVERNSIIEIGNLAGHDAGVTRFLFPLLTELTYRNGYHWVVCNATHKVQNALHRQGIRTLPLQQADPYRLGEARLAWGNYYATDSTVIAISPQQAHDTLQACRPDLLATCHNMLEKTAHSTFPVTH